MMPSRPIECSEIGKELTLTLPKREDVVQVHKMHKSIRSWAIVSLLLGGVSIFAGGVLDPVWGIVMIIVAILSWKVRIPAVFVIYSVIMGWAAVMNGVSVLVGGEVGWLVLALVQVFWMVSLVKQFRKYSYLPLQKLFKSGKWPAHLDPPQRDDVVTSRFAIAGIILAVTALILLPSVLVGTIMLVAITKPSQTPPQMVWLLSGIVDVAVLALGFSCAALLSKNDRRGWAIGGVVVSALVLIGWLGFLLLANFTR